MLSSGANVAIWDKMLSCGANDVILSFGANVIICCYHVMLSSGMITPPFLFFLKTSLTRLNLPFSCKIFIFGFSLNIDQITGDFFNNKEHALNRYRAVL
jgi:hypothetical protein